MNLLADEGVDRQIVARLRDEGHTVLYVAEIESGVSDEAVLDLANRQAKALLTADKDFGELVFRQGLITSSGVILIRLAGLTPEDRHAQWPPRSRSMPRSFSRGRSPSSRRAPFA